MLDRRVLVVEHLELLGTDQAPVTPGQAHGLAARLVDQTHDVLLHLAGQHPLHHFHGLRVGHAHALDELALLAQSVQCGLNLRPPAMHHHRVDPHQLQEHHVFREVRLQRRIGHGVAAILDDHGLAMELADVGQRLGEDFGFVAGGDVGDGGHEFNPSVTWDNR